MKIVFNGGGYRELGEYEIGECTKLGDFLASIGVELMTGGGTGFPYHVGKAAVAGGAVVHGRSPARNEKEHAEKYGFKFDGVTDMIYMEENLLNHNEGFLRRMQLMQNFADTTIAVAGTWGTLYELIISFYYKKTIIIIEEFAGAALQFKKLHEYFSGSGDTNPAVHLGPKLFFCKNVDETIEVVRKLNASNIPNRH